MLAYIVRRLMYTVPIVCGVLLVTFVIFNLVPGDISRELAGKNASQETVAEIRAELGMDKPKFVNIQGMEDDGVLSVFDSQFFNHFKNALVFDFGRSLKSKENVSDLILRGAGPSLRLTIPIFIALLCSSLTISLLVAFMRGKAFDHIVLFLCVTGLSLPYLAIILFGQYFLAFKLQWFPISGYEPGWSGAKYVVLPAIIGVLAGLGGDVRFYRTVMLDEMKADYVRTAYAKGVATRRVLFVHVLKNAMIPVITRVVLAIPFLFLGSLLLERFFGIPGLGYLMIEAIGGRDFPVISGLTFIISILFVVGNLATDICYALVDPRISLK